MTEAASGATPRAFGPAPSLDDIAAIATVELARLPEPFRSQVGAIAFRVEEFCDDGVLRDLQLDSPFELMGLYQGVAIGHKDSSSVADGPDMVFLYRRALIDYWADSEDSFETIVRHVLIHEIGHHFGLSDEDMEQIEAQAD